MIALYRALFFIGVALIALPVLLVIVGFLTVGSGANAGAFASLVGLLGIVVMPVLGIIALLTIVFGVLWHDARKALAQKTPDERT